MTHIALDTNAYVALAKGEPAVARAVRTSARIAMPVIVLGELRAGFAGGSSAKRNEQALTRFLYTPRVVVLLPTEDTTFIYGQLFAQLRQQGRPIPTNDLWIASLCLQYHFSLVTFDAHFFELPQLPVYPLN